MDNYVDERDVRLLEKDRYTFFVLSRVMRGPCKLLLSDHERLIICFTGEPYPVWIWTADDATEAEMEKAYRLAYENVISHGYCRFNLKYELAEYFIMRAAEDGITLKVSTNMFAYDCPDPVKPHRSADGDIYKCAENDIEELTDMMEMFHSELGKDQKSREEYRKDAEEEISTGASYLWKDANGNSVASAFYRVSDDLASVSRVFTVKQYRRKHYAENLVYRITVMIREQGYMPMLYTDADYIASNSCYEKVGYILKGKLCNLG